MRWVAWSAGVLAFIAVGCMDERPVYREPEAALKDMATLRGVWGTYIEGVDGTRVETVAIQFSDFGHNSVRVTGGVHRLVVMQEHSNGRLETETTTWFSFRCDAGHTYEMGPATSSGQRVLRVIDKTTGQSMIIKASEIQRESDARYLFTYQLD